MNDVKMHIEAYKHIIAASKNSQLENALKSIGSLDIPERDSHLPQEFLARSIVGQQLSVKAARTIWARFENLANDIGLPCHELPQHVDKELLRSCGMSYGKIKALAAVQEYFQTTEDPVEQLSLMNHKDRSNELTKIWGIGQWTCDMLSIFYFKEPDIWSNADAGLKRGLSKILNSDEGLSDEEFKKFGDKYQPYRSYLSLYLWHAADNKLFG